jgi:hypothetical protein
MKQLLKLFTKAINNSALLLEIYNDKATKEISL